MKYNIFYYIFLLMLGFGIGNSLLDKWYISIPYLLIAYTLLVLSQNEVKNENITKH